MAWPSSLARTKNWGTEILTDTDLEGQLDLIIDYINDMMNSSSGHKHDGTTAEGPKILTANINDSAGTAGDIYTNTSGTTVDRVAIGTAYQILQTNSGASAPEWATLSSNNLPNGTILQIVNSESQTPANSTNVVTYDTDPFAASEGTQLFSLAITPGATTNKILVRVVVQITHSASAGVAVVGLFNSDVDATNAVAVAPRANSGNNNVQGTAVLEKWYTASDLDGTSETTFTVRYGGTTGTTYINEANDGTNVYASKLVSSVTITEIKAS